ncbi:unnamed protein product [Didymodactylos carnosus]|uniref:HTH OST-type domain-containing protein n=1 Tax=Didymodactylos carnosus TaxID=1234261 RepID=A0A814PQJ1_9BILA|nr:unnamed protein product [Didymodactylos carnosus]CAF3873674.1 unnamed protein product [Didymodactylos carnosus]
MAYGGGFTPRFDNQSPIYFDLKHDIYMILVERGKQYGLTEHQLLREYSRKYHQRQLPFRELGYLSLIQLLKTMWDTVKIDFLSRPFQLYARMPRVTHLVFHQPENLKLFLYCTSRDSSRNRPRSLTPRGDNSPNKYSSTKVNDQPLVLSPPLTPSETTYSSPSELEEKQHYQQVPQVASSSTPRTKEQSVPLLSLPPEVQLTTTLSSNTFTCGEDEEQERVSALAVERSNEKDKESLEPVLEFVNRVEKEQNKQKTLPMLETQTEQCIAETDAIHDYSYNQDSLCEEYVSTENESNLNNQDRSSSKKYSFLFIVVIGAILAIGVKIYFSQKK